MRAALIGNREDTDPGLVGHALRTRGYSFIESCREDPGTLPPLDGIALVVSLGSGWSTYWPGVGEEVRAEQEYLAAAHGAGVPVLGICFGAQQLAVALGGEVCRAEAAEIGWHNVTSDSHPVLAGEWFQWHYDSITVPPGAQTLAVSPRATQAFRAGRSVGLQFHPEVTTQIVAHWSSAGGRGELLDEGIDPEELAAGTASRIGLIGGRVEALIGWFCENAGT